MFKNRKTSQSTVMELGNGILCGQGINMVAHKGCIKHSNSKNKSHLLVSPHPRATIEITQVKTGLQIKEKAETAEV